MMTTSSLVRGALGLVLIGALGTLLVGSAGAAPPPPPYFNDFTIINSTPHEVKNITIKLEFSNPGQRNTLLADSMDITITRLPAGRKFVLSPGANGDGLEGVSQITVNAQCPTGKGLRQAAKITADIGDYDNDGTQEYAGFCHKCPGGSTYLPRLEFKAAGTGYEAHLHAQYCWGGRPQPPVIKQDRQPFRP